MKLFQNTNKWFNRLFKGASLATVAIAFQACYGAPRDFGLDQYIEGVVTNVEGNPVQDICIRINDDSVQYVKSDAEGKFQLYVPRRHEYKITLFNMVGNEIVLKKDTTVEDRHSDISVAITLDQK